MSESFIVLNNFLKDNSDKHHLPDPDISFCWGKLKGYFYRAFVETINGDVVAYVVIEYDVAEDDHMWPAFYSVEEVQAWMNSL